MCGIWCIIKNNPDILKYIDNINKIKIRGPDSSNIFYNKNLLIAFHRLSINDISVNGNQPFYYSNNEYNYYLIINGEIYNHIDLEKQYNIKNKTKNDCIFLLQLFVLLNEDFYTLNNLIRGEYAMVIIKENKNNNIINYWMSVDPFSVRPLFYYIENNIIYISSILDGIANISDNIKRLNQGSYIEGITDCINYNYNNQIQYYKKPLPFINLENNDLYNQI